jgi:hypothetical protein
MNLTDELNLKLTRLHALLDEKHSWPGEYVFKFIVPNQKREELEAHFEGRSYQVRPSSNGKYMALTYRDSFSSSIEVIGIYGRVLSIEGLISL